MLIRGALVLPGGGDWQARRADIFIRDSRIAAVGKVAATGDERIIEASALLAVPGFVNAHYHSPLSILRGTADGLSHPAFMCRALHGARHRRLLAALGLYRVPGM